MFKDKVAVITGGCHGIGLRIAEEFAKAGAHVCVIDKNETAWFPGDGGMTRLMVYHNDYRWQLGE